MRPRGIDSYYARLQHFSQLIAAPDDYNITFGKSLVNGNHLI